MPFRTTGAHMTLLLGCADPYICLERTLTSTLPDYIREYFIDVDSSLGGRFIVRHVVP